LPAGNKEAGQGHAAGTSHDGPPGRKELAMAGSEQRPTDDVEGHGVKLPEDETTGDDRGTRFPDDTQGHAHRRPIQTPASGSRTTPRATSIGGPARTSRRSTRTRPATTPRATAATSRPRA
jgi:hypothetical protein